MTGASGETSTGTSVASHYVEMECLPDGHVSVGFLMGRLTHALHLTFVQATPAGARCDYGVSFPEYELPDGPRGSFNAGRPPIGRRVRVFSKSEDALDGLPWSRALSRLDDYVHRTAVRPCGRSTDYAIYARRQVPGSIGRQIRRAMKRHGLSEGQATERYASYSRAECLLPYVDMRSESSDQRFRLFIDRRPAPPSDAWGFSTYGLSTDVPLPTF